MPRVLHLISTVADYQTARGHAAVAGSLGPDHPSRTRTLGRGGDWRDVPAAVLGLRREAAADVIFAWGLSALTAAVVAVGRRTPVVFHPDRFLGPRGLRGLRAVMGFGDVHVVCPSDGQQRLAVRRGVPIDRCHLIRPGVDFGRVNRGRRDRSLRAALGLTDADYVLLAPGESTDAANHALAVWACGVLHILDPSYKVLLWGRGRAATVSAGLGRRLKQTGMVRAAEPMLRRPVAYEELLGAADACVVTATGSVPTLPTAAAMAAGLPVVAGVTYTTAELLEDRHTALMVPRATARTIARRVMDLRADPALAARLGDTARAEAYNYFGQARTLDACRTLLGKLFSDVAPPPTATAINKVLPSLSSAVRVGTD